MPSTKVDQNRWSPSEDRTGSPVAPGDRVSMPLPLHGVIQGILAFSDHSWVQLPDGTKIGALVVLTEEGVRYEATSKIRKLEDP